VVVLPPKNRYIYTKDAGMQCLIMVMSRLRISEITGLVKTFEKQVKPDRYWGGAMPNVGEGSNSGRR
jgi:hypothetical protein